MGNVTAHSHGVILSPRAGNFSDFKVAHDMVALTLGTCQTMLTEVEIMQSTAPVESQAGLISCSRHLTYILYGGKENFRYEKKVVKIRGSVLLMLVSSFST